MVERVRVFYKNEIDACIYIVSGMIPWLAQKYGGDRMSYIMLGCSQIIFPLAFLYANNNDINPV